MPRPKFERVRLPFDLPPNTASGAAEKARLHNPERLWTGDKARLFQRYLLSFIQMMRYRTYLDGFTGPQYPTRPDTWAAQLVLGPDGPQMLRHFYLFELDEERAWMQSKLATAGRGRDTGCFPAI